MISKPVVFISSTSDLRSARDLVGKVLYSMGYEPVWQDIESTDGGELLDILRKRIAPCQMVIQLVGDRYGAEPPYPSPEFGRVSYTQFEAMYAEKLGRKVVYHFLTGTFPTDPISPESDELRNLQAAYRQRIIAINKLHQDNITSRQDLELSIHRIRDELSAMRKEGEKRSHRLMAIAVASLVGIGVIGSLIAYEIRGQSHVTAKFDQMTTRLDESEDLIKQFLAERPLDAKGRPIIPQLKGDLLARAQEMIAKGNKRQQLEAAVAMNDFSTADRLQSELRAQIKSEREAEDYDLAALEGARWYRAGEFDRAIQPFEEAFALRPNDIIARDNLTRAHAFCRLGNIADHQHRAIDIATGTLAILPVGSVEWGKTQNVLGIAWENLRTGDRAQNLHKAVKAYQAASTTVTRTSDPTFWAESQNNLGDVWSESVDGNRSQNLQTAVADYQAALTVFTRESDPLDWALVQNNLGSAWEAMTAGDRSQNLQNALTAFESALNVYTETAHPTDWAMVQYNIASLWDDMPTGDRAQNLQKAILGYEQALKIRTKEANPNGWALTQTNLAIAWYDMPGGDRELNLRKALAATEASLEIFTRQVTPNDWARSQGNLGMLWNAMPTGNVAQNRRKSIAAYEAALTVYSINNDPEEWGKIESNIALEWAELEDGDRLLNAQNSIDAYQAALTFYTKVNNPLVWAKINCNLGFEWENMPGDSQRKYVRQSIAASRAALTVYTEKSNLAGWIKTQSNLSIALQICPTGDRAENLRGAIACAKAALLACPPQTDEKLNRGASVRVSSLRRIYERLPAATTQPFDLIAPAS